MPILQNHDTSLRRNWQTHAMKSKTTVLFAALFMSAGFVFAATNDLATLLQKGLLEEEANHNLQAAMRHYQAAIDGFDQERLLAATAVFRLGECLRKLGRTNEAGAQYERVLREFPDQTNLVKLCSDYLGGAKTATLAAGAPDAMLQQLQGGYDGIMLKLSLAEGELATVTNLIRPDRERYFSTVKPDSILLGFLGERSRAEREFNQTENLGYGSNHPTYLAAHEAMMTANDRVAERVDTLVWGLQQEAQVLRNQSDALRALRSQSDPMLALLAQPGQARAGRGFIAPEQLGLPNPPPAYVLSIGDVVYPGGVAVDSAGNVYVSDTRNNRIKKLTGQGVPVTQWGGLGKSAGSFNYPQGLATDGSNNLYVADVQNHRIQKFTADGTFITQWGELGADPGKFNRPYNVAVDKAGNVYVADHDNNRVEKFTSDGKYLKTFGAVGTGAGQLQAPQGVAVDESGNVYVGDGGNGRIQKFSADGVSLLAWQCGNHDVAVDGRGHVYVVSGDSIKVFSSTGALLTQWGSTGSGPGEFNFAARVAVDAAGSRVYVTDAENNRVQIFAYLPPSASAGGVASPATTAEDEEVRKIQEMIRNSPDLINAGLNGGNTPLQPNCCWPMARMSMQPHPPWRRP
jgi:DNA-binding beta-propeller fold protein YncE